MGALATFVLTVYLYGLVPKGFIPGQDQGFISGQTEFPQDASFDSMVDSQRQGAGNNAGESQRRARHGVRERSSAFGRINARLKPRSERKLSPEQVIEQLRPKLNAIPGARQYLTNPPLVRIGAQNSRSLYQFTLQAADLNDAVPCRRGFREAHAADSRVDRVSAATCRWPVRS